MVPADHGTPAEGGLLDVFWAGRRASAFDEMCTR
jgi:hypothetical protein